MISCSKRNSASSGATRNSQRAFTLLELLAALGVLLVIAALLFPAMKAVVVRGRTTKCINNLRQIGAAFYAAAAEQNGLINFQSHDIPNSTKRWNNYLIEGGYLEKQNQIAFCPTLAVVNGVRASGDGGYIYGGIGSAEADDPYSGPVAGFTAAKSRAIRLNTIDRPANYWLLVDTWSTSNNHQLYILLKSRPDLKMHLRHGGKANMLFADGHVAAVDLENTKDFLINPLTSAFDEKRQPVAP